jgi:hypothetical protein
MHNVKNPQLAILIFLYFCHRFNQTASLCLPTNSSCNSRKNSQQLNLMRALCERERKRLYQLRARKGRGRVTSCSAASEAFQLDLEMMAGDNSRMCLLSFFLARDNSRMMAVECGVDNWYEEASLWEAHVSMLSIVGRGEGAHVTLGVIAWRWGENIIWRHAAAC